MNLLKKVRLEIAVNEDFVKPTVDAIIAGARTGQIGDGKIFIVDLARPASASARARRAARPIG